MGIPPLLPVANDTVEDAVQHHQQADGLEIFTQVLNVVADDTVAGVDIGLVGEHVQAAGGEQLQRQRNFMGNRLLLPHKVIVEVFQRGRFALVFADVLAVDVGSAAVDDGLLLCADLARAHELFTQRHDELAFQYQRVTPVAVLLGDVQRVDIAAVGGGDGDDLAAQGADQRAILPLGVYHNNIVVGIQPHEADLLLCHHGLAAAGHARIQAVSVEHRVAVADDEVAGHGVDAVVQAAGVHDLLRLEGQQHGGALRGQRPHTLTGITQNVEVRPDRALCKAV